MVTSSTFRHPQVFLAHSLVHVIYPSQTGAEPADGSLPMAGQELIAAPMDEVAKRSEGHRARLGFQLLGDDERQRDLGLVFLALEIDDLHLYLRSHPARHSSA